MSSEMSMHLSKDKTEAWTLGRGIFGTSITRYKRVKLTDTSYEMERESYRVYEKSADAMEAFAKIQKDK